MGSEILINVTPSETRIAVVENGVLQDIYVERAKRRGLVGNIYKGKVCRVLPGMQAAFVEVGLDRAAFLHASDIAQPNPQSNTRTETDSSCDGTDEPTRIAEAAKTEPPIGRLLTEGQEIIVQVIKDPIGTKGARLTTHCSIPACYLVYIPDGDGVGVSQRIEDEEERDRLRELIKDAIPRVQANSAGAAAVEDLPAPGGYIARTAAEYTPAEVLHADMKFLHRLWASLQERARSASVPSMVHEDLPLVIRTLRELISSEMESIRIDSRVTYQRVLEFANQFIPELVNRIQHYPGERPIFDLYGVEDEIDKSLKRKVSLKSGGYLILDQTEAMTTIDVNTGAYVGSRNLEETIFKTNLEAAHAIARQLRLRNLGGIIICDFIDMESAEHKRQVLRALEKSLERDHTRTHISEVSSLGLVQMTRKRTRESLEHILCEPCPTCSGRGSLKTRETVCYEIFREILRESRQYDAQRFLVLASQEVVDALMDEESTSFAELESFIGKPITLQTETLYLQEQFDVVLM